METRYVRHLLRSATAGSFLLLSTVPVSAGRLFPDEPSRPHVSAACAPNWGYNQTCWQKFPPVPPCDGAAGCELDPGVSFPSHDSLPHYEQSGAIYAPQSGLFIPEQNMPAVHGSVIQPSPEGFRYAPSHSMDGSSGGKGIPFVLPRSSGSAATKDFVEPSPLSGQAAPMMAPGSSTIQTPAPVQTFGASPTSPSSLPPLPTPPSSVQPVPGQSSLEPNRLMIGRNGRVAVVPAASPTIQSSSPSSRYGRRTNSMPGTVPSQTAPSSIITPANNGTPVHLANKAVSLPNTAQSSSRYGQRPQTSASSGPVVVPTTKTALPIRSISASRPANNATSGSSRYAKVPPTGNQSSAAATTGQTSLEPLRRTPLLPEQK